MFLLNRVFMQTWTMASLQLRTICLSWQRFCAVEFCDKKVKGSTYSITECRLPELILVLLVLLQLTEFIEFILLFFIIVTTGHNRFCKLVSCRLRIGDKATGDNIGDVSHNPGGRLPLLSTRPAVTPTTLKRAATNFAAWWTEAQWVWTVCLRLLPDIVATAIWTQALLHLSPARWPLVYRATLFCDNVYVL